MSRDLNEIETENDKEFKEVSQKINDFTTILNKYNLSYTVEMFPSGEGYTIFIDDICIDFHFAGAIKFEKNNEKNE